MLLLTDGMPTVSPPQGDVGAFEAYLEEHPALEKRFQLHTFGFGYGLDSKLLLELAATGRGAFSFIPDAKIVGTVFVNCVANALSCATQRATLHLAQGRRRSRARAAASRARASRTRAVARRSRSARRAT